MIWLWIALAVATTALLLRNKKIAPHNFLWALLPINKYGISLGFVLKPAYIFSLLLIAYSIITKKFKLRISRSVLISTIFLVITMVLSMLFKGSADISEDIRIYSMLILTIFCAVGSISMIEGKDDLRQISDVMVATAVGYGIVFIVLYFLDSVGIYLPAVKASEAWDDSIIRIFGTMINKNYYETVRLRGFYLDPNVASVFFSVGFASLLGDWIKNGKPLRNIIYSVIILTNIILTSSRTALIVCALFIVISIFRLFFTKYNSRKKIIFFGAVLSILFIGSIIMIYNNRIISYFYEKLLSSYSNRSSLYDEMGRFSIWKEAISLLNSSNWYCGVGFNNISKIIESNRDAHNTLIELFCSSGVIIGITYTLYFLSPFFFAIKQRINNPQNGHHLTNFAVAYLGVLLSALTVSHIVNIYMVYIAFLLFIIPSCLAEENELKISEE